MIMGAIMTEQGVYYINPKSLVTFKELVVIIKLSRSTINNLIKQDLFPKPIRVTNTKNTSKQKRLWLYQDIIDFLNNVENKKYIKYENQRERAQTKHYEWNHSSKERKRLGLKDW